jgi:hypothetical protein
VDSLVDALAVVGSLGSLTALVSLYLLRRQRRAEITVAEHTAAEVVRDDQFEWYTRWQECVEKREEMEKHLTEEIRNEKERRAASERRLQDALAREALERQRLASRVASLEAQLRGAGLDPVNGG